MTQAKTLDGFSILVCEDDKAIQETLIVLLERWGATVYSADDGVIGLKLFITHKPQVIITDVKMPNLDGISMLEEIKQLCPKVPSIVITAFDDKEFMIKAIDLGVDKIFFKPFSTIQLRDALEKIYEKIELEQEIQKERQYYQALKQSTIFSKSDLEGNITEVNDNLLKISGYTKEELIGKPHSIFRHPDMKPETFKEMWQTIQSGRVYSGVVKSKNKKGGTFIVNATIVPLMDSSGKIYEYMSIRQDITEQERLKDKIEKEKEKTQKLQTERAIDHAKEGFLLIFTHELKTPLNAIINFCEYVRKAIGKSDIPNKEKLVSLLEATRSNAYYMLESITNTLDIAKIKSGKITYNKTSFNLHSLIRQMMSRHESLLSEQFGVATFRGDPNCFVSSDEFRVLQILSNIYSNAIKYAKGEILVTLSCNSEKTTVTIEDNGSGIAGKTSLFNLFDQGEEYDTTRVSKGTGIGLHFVKLLCEGLKIEYQIETSKELGGTKFILIFKK